MAQAFRVAYTDLYSRNEYWHTKSTEDLKNFLVEVLEVEKNNPTLVVLIRTIETLKKLANFEASVDTDEETEEELETEKSNYLNNNDQNKIRQSDLTGVNLSYTINLNLPETSDGKVFDAIFKSLKENLLKK
jgi:hypothetical protein